jgi:hypothetical protein
MISTVQVDLADGLHWNNGGVKVHDDNNGIL